MFSGELYRCHREGFKEQDVSSREGAATPGKDHGRLVIPRTGRETVKRGDGSLVIGTRGTLLSLVLAYGIIWSEPECRAYVSFSGPGGRQLRTPEYVTPTIPVPLRFCCVVSLLPSRFDNTGLGVCLPNVRYIHSLLYSLVLFSISPARHEIKSGLGVWGRSLCIMEPDSECDHPRSLFNG